MARWEPWSIIDGAYADDTRPWSSQDTVNWLPTPAEQAGTRSPVMLRTPPGLELYVDLGTNAPLRGSHDVEGLLLVVSGDTLFKVINGVATDLGTIPGVGRVSMDHVPRGTGFQVGIANGSSGYVYNTADDTLVQITDEGFPGAIAFQFVDNFLAFLEPFGRFWGHSELNDALSYNTLDRYTAESAPDPIRALIQSHREIFTPGTRSGEFFRNTGAATGTFQRSDGTEMERGCANAFAIVRWDNTVAWLGDDGKVYRLEGHQPVRISTGPIEQAIARAGSDNAFMFTWDDRGHDVVYLTLPNGQTWGFDAWTQRWHRRESYGLERWRLSTLTKTRGEWIGGDYRNGKLYRLVWQNDAVHENGAPLVSRRRFPVAHDNGNPLTINGIKLAFDTGQGGPTSPDIAGDVPDSIVGMGSTGAYTVSGGIPPYGAITVQSGTFPTGLTLATDGTWSGMFSEAGSFSWTVGGLDAFGAPFSTPDTCTVAANVDPLWDDVVSLWRPTGEAGSTTVVDEKPIFWGSPDEAQKPTIVEDEDSFSLTALNFDPAGIGQVTYTATTSGGSVVDDPFGMGTGDFTYEGFVTFDTVTGTQTVVQIAQSTPALMVQITGGQWQVQDQSSGVPLIAPAGTALAGRRFVSLQRATGVLSLYVDNVLIGSAALVFDYSTAQSTHYGRQQNGSNPIDGRLDMWRITKGHARTPAIPLIPFPNTGP